MPAFAHVYNLTAPRHRVLIDDAEIIGDGVIPSADLRNLVGGEVRLGWYRLLDDGGAVYVGERPFHDYNPYHDPETGEFTTAEGAGEASGEKEEVKPSKAAQLAKATAKMAAEAKVTIIKSSENPDFIVVKVGGALAGHANVTGTHVSFTPKGSLPGDPKLLYSSVEEMKTALGLGNVSQPSTLPPPKVEFVAGWGEEPATGNWSVNVGGTLAGHAVGGLVPGEPILYQTVGGVSKNYPNWKALEEALVAEASGYTYKNKAVGLTYVYKGGELQGILTATGQGVEYSALKGPGAGQEPVTYPSMEEAKAVAEGKPLPARGARHQQHPTLAPAAIVPISALPEPVARTDGSEWNQGTSIRLAQEHHIKREAIQASVASIEGKQIKSVVAAWSDLPSDVQYSVEKAWKKSQYSIEYQHLEEHWRSHDALTEAMDKIALETSPPPAKLSEEGERLAQTPANDDWAVTAIEEREGERDKPYPFTHEQILDALIITVDESMGDPRPHFVWDNEALDTPIGTGPDQLWLPGMQGEPPHFKLTAKMRTDIEGALDVALRAKADDLVGSLDPPEHLMEEAEELAEQLWDATADDDKYLYGLRQGEFSPDDKEAVVVAMPDKPDPMNVRSDANYRATQRVAKALTIERAQAVYAERGLEVPTADVIDQADDRLWQGWVASSTDSSGVILQMVAADELGGRLNDDRLAMWGGRTGVESMADAEYKWMGGYEGLKAYIRGKWETTQEIMERAGIEEVQVYRGIALEESKRGPEVSDGQYRKLPEADIKRNGLASFSTDPAVTNNWGGEQGRVVVRATVPRTAVLSFPAYGKNIHSEHEVILAGTGWTGWDAWAGAAPSFERSPMQLQRGTSAEQQAWATRKKAQEGSL